MHFIVNDGDSSRALHDFRAPRRGLRVQRVEELVNVKVATGMGPSTCHGVPARRSGLPTTPFFSTPPPLMRAIVAILLALALASVVSAAISDAYVVRCAVLAWRSSRRKRLLLFSFVFVFLFPHRSLARSPTQRRRAWLQGIPCQIQQAVQQVSFTLGGLGGRVYTLCGLGL